MRTACIFLCKWSPFSEPHFPPIRVGFCHIYGMVQIKRCCPGKHISTCISSDRLCVLRPFIWLQDRSGQGAVNDLIKGWPLYNPHKMNTSRWIRLASLLDTVSALLTLRLRGHRFNSHSSYTVSGCLVKVWTLWLGRSSFPAGLISCSVTDDFFFLLQSAADSRCFQAPYFTSLTPYFTWNVTCSHLFIQSFFSPVLLLLQ